MNPCNKMVKTITEHPKFFPGGLDCILEQLKIEKEAEPKIIPYHILFSKETPQYAILCYLKQNEFIQEYIKIENDSYQFHHALFVNFNELINYFKHNYNSPDYIKKIQSSHIPFNEIVIEDNDEVEGKDLHFDTSFGIGKKDSK